MTNRPRPSFQGTVTVLLMAAWATAAAAAPSDADAGAKPTVLAAAPTGGTDVRPTQATAAASAGATN